MNNILDIYEKQLKKEQDGLNGVLQELSPLEKKKVAFEENIKALKQLIEVEKERNRPIIKSNAEIEVPSFTARLTGQSAEEAYIELVNIDFKDKSFRDKDIRELANKEGLLINNEFISSSYSRATLARLCEKDFLEKPERGLYRRKKQEAIESMRSGSDY